MAVIGVWLLWSALRKNLGGLEVALALPLVFWGLFALSRYYRGRGGVPLAAVTPGAGWLFANGLLASGWSFGIFVSSESGVASQGVWAGLGIFVAGRRFPLHRLVGAALIGLSLALPYPLASAARLSTIWNLVWLALACAIVVLSIYEHRTFTQTEHTRPDDEAENTAPA